MRPLKKDLIEYYMKDLETAGKRGVVKSRVFSLIEYLMVVGSFAIVRWVGR